MSLKLHDTLQNHKVIFRPLKSGIVKIYVCGVTVYDLCHVGHARTFVCFDVIIRYLRHLGYQTLFVRNITDVDDKIINRARELGCSPESLTQDMTEKMHEDFKALNLLSPDVEPKATEHIKEIIEIIKILLEKDAAYIAKSKDVYFKVSACEDYGSLSKQNIKELIKEFRVDAQTKESAEDFVLWKVTHNAEEIAWASPWGLGRPGWHIECSAMSRKWLGKSFDIHGGGGDLKFPHHENERAQSLCANDNFFANYWMHTGMIQVSNEKMSKSLKNFLTIREVLEQQEPEVLRYFLLMAHYRSPLQYNEENLHLARQNLYRLYNALYEAELCQLDICEEKVTNATNESIRKNFEESMQDDFNVPGALSSLFELANQIFKEVKNKNFCKVQILAAELRALGHILGFLENSPIKFLQTKKSKDVLREKEKIEELVQKRQNLRKNQQWNESDLLRKTLLEIHGVIVEDRKEKTFWRYV